ncbi:pilus assembly protein PilY [Cupriavidus pauculus]|uniref:pilus assembly protein PilY n=1 Tax=Cupriavidus pauculus TaxID=82633 RepID=UPI001D0C44D8|nr:pilus assembly protein PilY [Cupriavidus pauculus]
MRISQRIHLGLTAIALAISPVTLCASPPGQLPLGYRISNGDFPWTGRLHALAFRTASPSSSAVLTKWEAGFQLDQRQTPSRQLYLGGAHLGALHWDSIDAEAKVALDSVDPTEHGANRLAWLRGDRTDTSLRPRDTRLGSASGARIHLVLPPQWLPMQPGHADYRRRHVSRPVTLWLGTRDGLVHQFDALSGDERAAYLPYAMLAGAASLTSADGPVPAAPCPRPESVDADPGGTWRTLLLCGVPASETPRFTQPGAVFVLDISDPDAEASQLGLLWEVGASPALPISGDGPIRAAMWIEHGVRRWAVVAALAPDVETSARAGIALLPLDRSPQFWAASGNVPRIGLPDAGCGVPAATAHLLATTVNGNVDGTSQAAYVVDDTGRLWRFGLDHLSRNDSASPATCMHRHQAPAPGQAEAPVVIQTGTGPLVVFGSGGELSAIPDRPGRGMPAQVDALAHGDGVVLRTHQAGAATSENGWTLRLPHEGERIETLQGPTPVHLSFTTVTPDGRQRSYLVDAATGESVIATDANGAIAPAVTGLPFDGEVAPVVVSTATSTGADTSAGKTSRDAFRLELWQIDGDTARLTQQATWYRQRGRLGWRELIRSPS